MKTLEQEIKQSKFRSQEEKAVVNLIYTAKLLEDQIKAVLSSFSITNPQYNILRILNGSDPNPLSPGAIKEVMLFKGSDLTRLLDRLFTKDLIERIVCPSNRRMVEVRISKKGKALLDKIRPVLENLFANIGSGISQEDLAAMNTKLDQIRSVI